MSNELKNLSLWKESLFRLPENKFLNIVRMYIGTIKTPYNKERLINDMVSFLYKEDHKKTIVSLLSKKDIIFLSAVHVLEKPTKEALHALFEGEFSTFYLYDYISNLEERLLIYYSYDSTTKKEYLEINPLLQDNLKPFLNVSVLIPVAQKACSATQQENYPVLNASLFASWYTFIAQFPDACRADGSFKKKTIANLETIFYGIPIEFLATFHNAFVNLGLFFHDGSNLCINEKKWKAFSSLSQETQRIYICISSFRRFPRDILIKQSNFTKSLLDEIPLEGFTNETLLRLSFILKNTQKKGPTEQKKGFFEKVLQRAQNPSLGEEDDFTQKALIDRLVYFGVLHILGKDINGKDIYCNKDTQNEISFTDNKPFMSINAGFSVTFLQCVPLEIFLPLVACMNIESYDTVCRFEITRASCMRSFDKGENNETLLQNLEKASGNSISQNLAFSINEWFETYNSASLYHGYVLQVSQEKIVQIENNIMLKPRIKKILAPGIYIFDFETREEMIEAVEKSSLDFIGLPKNSIKEPDILPFSDLQSKNSMHLDYFETSTNDEHSLLEHIKNMKKELENLNLPIEQKEGLLERISRKLIVSPKQLIGETVRSEKTEASGIDFMGKIQVIEQAILSSNLIEITCATGVFSGRPIKIEKKDGDAGVTLSQEDGKTTTLLIGQARNVKRFRQPLY